MKLDFSMEIKQTQKLHMTKELKQAIDILQMNSQDLELLISEELNENPVLEAEWGDDIDWGKFALSIKDYMSSKFYEENEYHENEIDPNNFLKEEVTLYDHLLKEISAIDLDTGEREIALYIIQQVNENGYLSMDIECCSNELSIAPDEFLSVLKKIQNIEPSGLLARDLKECLLLQLESKEQQNDILVRMIKEDLEDIANKRYPLLMRKYKISKEHLGRIIQKIKSLDPKPGKRFSDFSPQYILPDVIVEKNGLQVEVLDNRTLPRLYISDLYQRLLNESEDTKTREFLRSRLNSALSLIRNIEHRKNTIHKVAEQIILFQKDFFSKEKAPLVPMKLKDISIGTGFHESTISRTVNGKYMLTPKGLFEFKYFLSSSINNREGGELSNKDIKLRILRMVKDENKKRPLSDQKIKELLNDIGIVISRRTIAKYREELGILSSSQRKEI